MTDKETQPSFSNLVDDTTLESQQNEMDTSLGSQVESELKNAQETEHKTENLTADPKERAKPSKIDKPKSKLNPLYVMIGSVLGVVVLTVGGIKLLAGGGEESYQNVQMPSQQTQAQMQQKALAQTQSMPQQMPQQTQIIENKVEQLSSIQQQSMQISNEQEINLGSAQSMTFSEDGDIYDPHAKKTENRPKTIKEILATKQLNELSDKELADAYQIFDRTRLEAEDSFLAVRERMVEKGLALPSSSLEERQELRDLKIAKDVADKLNKQFADVLEKMNKNLTVMNQNQLAMKADFEAAIQRISSKIEIDKINAEKDKLRYGELTNANSELLSQYSVSSILNNRVWLLEKGSKKTISVTVGDTLGNNIVIERIDQENGIVHTNKGNIK